MLQASVSVKFPSQVPPFSSTIDLTLLFVRVPLPQVFEHSPYTQSSHWQSIAKHICVIFVNFFKTIRISVFLLYLVYRVDILPDISGVVLSPPVSPGPGTVPPVAGVVPPAGPGPEGPGTGPGSLVPPVGVGPEVPVPGPGSLDPPSCPGPEGPVPGPGLPMEPEPPLPSSGPVPPVDSFVGPVPSPPGPIPPVPTPDEVDEPTSFLLGPDPLLGGLSGFSAEAVGQGEIGKLVFCRNKCQRNIIK